MTLDEAIKLYTSNTEYERIHGSLQGCLDFKQLAEWLKELKQLREQTRWILCSEKMPTEHEWMGTKRFGTTISDEVYVTLETPDGERFTEHLSFQNGGLSQADQERMRVWFKGAVPIAWMPLPESYNAEREE